MRLDGWKSIAAHFGRERSTVIRWSTERGMPVHRIPGTGRGSVYALTEELDAWLEADREVPADDPVAPVEQPPRSLLARLKARSLRELLLGAAAIVALISLSAIALGDGNSPQPPQVLPEDAALAELYLEARSEWAARNPQSIESAIAKLRQVVAADPGFAPAYAALADSYVLAREFGSLGDVDAFARAQAAADAALRIDPANPDALRAAGFIQYWWRGDAPAAAQLFRRSITANPQAAQSHFWFGNVLVDNGDFAAGLAELERARLLEPASLALQADIAWARWSQGDEDRALAALEAMREDHPGLATVRDYLAVIYLGRGDVAGFVAENAAQAEIRNLAPDIEQSRRLQQALATNEASVLAMLVRELDAELATGARTALPWPVFVATVAGDRASVVRYLELGQARDEKWGSAGLLRHVRESWPGDRQVQSLLNALMPGSLAQS